MPFWTRQTRSVKRVNQPVILTLNGPERIATNSPRNNIHPTTGPALLVSLSDHGMLNVPAIDPFIYPSIHHSPSVQPVGFVSVSFFSFSANDENGGACVRAKLSVRPSVRHVVDTIDRDDQCDWTDDGFFFFSRRTDTGPRLAVLLDG